MPFVATTSWKRLVLLLLGCGGFVALCLFLLTNQPMGAFDAVVLRFGILFFGLGVVVAIWRVLSPRETLKIDGYGLTWSQRSDQTIPWSAIKDVGILIVGRNQNFLAVTLKDPDRYPPDRKPRKPGPSLSTRLYGGEIHVQIGSLNTSPKKVMAAVDQYWPPRDR